MADIRILLNDRVSNKLEPRLSGQYRARDTLLKGFHVVVGRRKETFAVQGDLRRDRQRAASLSVRIGDVGTMSTRQARATAKIYLAQISMGEHPNPQATLPAGSARGDEPVDTISLQTQGLAAVQRGVTLRQAWEGYRDAYLIRKGRSPGTIEGYRDHVERLFKDWLDVSLQELADNPAKVITKHDEITAKNGPYVANGAMRTLRAIYNHACKAHRSLSPDNPPDLLPRMLPRCDVEPAPLEEQTT